jgi:transcriptional regulator with XRE-family HTH domain
MGLTLTELAARVGMTPDYLSKLEHGRRRRVQPPTLLRLARAVGVEPADLRLAEPEAAAA